MLFEQAYPRPNAASQGVKSKDESPGLRKGLGMGQKGLCDGGTPLLSPAPEINAGSSRACFIRSMIIAILLMSINLPRQASK